MLTGATGFVGRPVAHSLHALGHSLIALVRGPDPQARLDRAKIPASAVGGDLDDTASLHAAVAGADTVVHLAAVVDPALQANALRVLLVNRDLTMELARVAECEGVRRFVFVSSIAAMGFWSGLATATSACRPTTPYGRAKREAELALLAMARPGFEVVILRPPTVYGPGEAYNFLSLVRSVASGVFRLIGSGANRFPLATTENVARAITAAVAGTLPAGVHLVADREPYSLARVHAAIEVALGKRRTRITLPPGAARVAGAVNEALHRLSPSVPVMLTRARVRTLTVDQHFDVAPLLESGVALDAPLEDWVTLTVRDYERRGVLG
ncbi:MAG TPA: NAD-dependent epimerase/dehydratase family protein [Polyangiaceae bacterium]|nr:NAD-dependent epimerase/dehydratase family protein [Polyangiaceae bacterium]